MYRLYVEAAKKEGQKYVNQHTYNDIFAKDFNISFFKPKKDACDTCTSYTNSTAQQKIEMQSDYDLHHKNKTISRQLKIADVAAATKDKTVCTACFDYQKILATPKTENSCLYYKRKLSVMNFTIYDCGQKKGYCFCYDENEANRGSNEVSSCLVHSAGLKVKEGITEFHLYCDNCSGQNKNKGVLAAIAYAATLSNVVFILTFLEPGHTQNEADSVNASIERHAAMRQIFIPEDWYTIIRDAKVTGYPYEVITVTHTDIHNFKKLAKGLNWNAKQDKIMKDGTVKKLSRQIRISQIKQFSVGSGEKYHAKYRTSFDEEFSTLILRTRENHVNIEKYVLLRAYESLQGVTEVKKKDLMILCANNIIPPMHHAFYNALPTVLTKSVDDSEEVELS
ncbi:hypothetical protein QAD02_002208 [Eretmocerus hayati]|uniref:Uncharacterized protein n=1 Tax=Eretmocerus hayati TaxID=131215 RepID=A0ACC2NIJ4_9HYME|nr:hypothetical protein QAD02_002208 [Eretmocerus hayati]